MKVDLEELKRLHAERFSSADGTMQFAEYLVASFPAIVAKLEAAQKLRDAVEEFKHSRQITYPVLYECLAAFDKEQE